MYLPLKSNAVPPKFKECAKHPAVEEKGFVLYFTDQCPFTCYWVPRVREAANAHDIPLKVIHVTDREEAQKCTRTGHDLCIVQGRKIRDTCDTVR